MSIYNNKLNCIFIHLPRTAGTSIESIIGGQGHKDIIYFKRFAIGQSDLEWKKIFKFAFVRNPYDRFISCYKWARGNVEGWETIDINDLAENIVSKYETWDKESLESLMFKEQWRYICNQYYIPQIDFIGRYENLEDDWTYIAKKLGIERKLPHLNKGTKVDHVLTSKTRDIIREIYLKDFETFGYNT